MRALAILVTFCFIFIGGCVPSRTQYYNIVKAINERSVLSGYTKEYVKREFGPPVSSVKTVSDGKDVETWIYRTNMGERYLIINPKPGKVRHMKIVFVNGFILDAVYE